MSWEKLVSGPRQLPINPRRLSPAVSGPGLVITAAALAGICHRPVFPERGGKPPTWTGGISLDGCRPEHSPGRADLALDHLVDTAPPECRRLPTAWPSGSSQGQPSSRVLSLAWAAGRFVEPVAPSPAWCGRRLKWTARFPRQSHGAPSACTGLAFVSLLAAWASSLLGWCWAVTLALSPQLCPGGGPANTCRVLLNRGSLPSPSQAPVPSL